MVSRKEERCTGSMWERGGGKASRWGRQGGTRTLTKRGIGGGGEGRRGGDRGGTNLDGLGGGELEHVGNPRNEEERGGGC